MNTFLKICRRNTVVNFRFFTFFLSLSLFAMISHAQDTEVRRKKNAINTNLTLSATNEFNIGIERYFSPRKSIEINGGFVRANPFLSDLTKSWINTQYFYESGYTFRLGLKFYKKRPEESKWQDYISPVLLYKYLFFDPQWFENPIENSDYSECIYQKRQRSKYGFEFLWGKVYSLNNSFDFELYYGVGIRAAMVERTDISKQDTCGVSPIRQLDFVDNSFYVRPSIHGGAKFRFNF